jgi:hypothetical protein
LAAGWVLALVKAARALSAGVVRAVLLRKRLSLRLIVRLMRGLDLGVIAVALQVQLLRRLVTRARVSRQIAMMMRSLGISGRKLLGWVVLLSTSLRRGLMLVLVLLSMRMRGRRGIILRERRKVCIVVGVGGVLE